jgi:DNA-binding CsgD family transcriptional regulator/PAS domain-containing protein
VDKGARHSDVGLEAFSKVVEAIYDCSLDPTHWQDTVEIIGELLTSQRCALGVINYADGGRSEVAYYSGYDEETLRLHNETYSRISPLFPSIQFMSIGDEFTQSMIIDDEEFFASRYYQEWVKPQKLHDALMVKVLQTGQRTGMLAANRDESHARYGEADLRLLTLLSPHICRAVAISDALNLKTVRSEALETTLDALTSAVYLADRYGRVVYMNRAAEQQVRIGNAVRIDNKQLAPIDQAARVALAKSIAETADDECEAPSQGYMLALPGRQDAGVVATVLPLTRGERRNVCDAFSASVAIFVQDPVVVPPFPGEAFAKLHGLTGGELRVLLAMAPGLGVKEAADMLGISETTAKTHLQHIYEKTGTSKQTELMNLFMSSAPPVKPR